MTLGKEIEQDTAHQKGRTNERYGLELADGTIWELAGDEEVSDWLAELVHIMGCAPTEKSPTHTIHFHGVIDLGEIVSSTPRFIPPGRDNWEPFKNGAIHRVWRHADQRDIHIELNKTFLDHDEIRYINMWSAVRELHRHALKNGGTPIHATLAALNGKGVLIAGDGGVGKSTCYRRLPDDWDRLCDDQALILEIKDGCFRVHPLPTWSDHLWRKSQQQWQVERSVPLCGVFFLEQAAVDEVIPFKDASEALLKYFEAAKQIWQPIWAKVAKAEKTAQSTRLFDNVNKMAQSVSGYRLRATLNGRFWEKMKTKLDAS